MNLKNKKIIIAHRGASAYLPEHTLESKAMAYAFGADFLEQDLVLSKDNVPVVIHDIHLETVSDVLEKFPKRARTDGSFYVIDFTLEELKTLSVFERFNPSTNKQVFSDRFPFKKSSFRLHTLEEEIELIQGLNKSTGQNIGIYTEIKEPSFHLKEGKDISKIVLDILSKYDYSKNTDLCFLQCFDNNELKRIKFELKSNLKLIQLLEDDLSKISLKEIARYADGIGPWYQSIIKGKDKNDQLLMTDLVIRAHKLNLLVHPYTFRQDDMPDYIENFEQMLEIGLNIANFDGIFTDFPDKGVQFLKNNA